MLVTDHEPPAQRLPCSILSAEVYRAPVDNVGRDSTAILISMARSLQRMDGKMIQNVIDDASRTTDLTEILGEVRELRREFNNHCEKEENHWRGQESQSKTDRWSNVAWVLLAFAASFGLASIGFSYTEAPDDLISSTMQVGEIFLLMCILVLIANVAWRPHADKRRR